MNSVGCNQYKHKGFVLYTPLIFFLLYLYFTVFVFAYGPWPWPVDNSFELYMFLNLAHIALTLGYISGCRSEHGLFALETNINKIVYWSLLINLLVFVPTYFARTGGGSIDIQGALSNPGARYTESLEVRDGTNVTVEYLRIIFGPLLAIALPSVFYYWSILDTKIKTLGVAYIVLTILLYINMGTNKSIADIVMLAPWLVYASSVSGFFKISRVRILISLIAFLVSFAFFLSFFSLGQSTRFGSSAVSGVMPQAGISADFENIIVDGLPPLYVTGILGLSSYITQGYYALSLSLEKPFIPMYGVGNSVFLTRNAGKLLNNDELIYLSYPGRISDEDGWSLHLLWTTIYPWLASDFSFPGTIIVIFFIGRLFAMTWIDCINTRHPLALAAFTQFLIMLYYFPANNQCMQSGESVTSFLVIVGFWLFMRSSRIHTFIFGK